MMVRVESIKDVLCICEAPYREVIISHGSPGDLVCGRERVALHIGITTDHARRLAHPDGEYGPFRPVGELACKTIEYKVGDEYELLLTKVVKEDLK
jgi:hypothetical protein